MTRLFLILFSVSLSTFEGDGKVRGECVFNDDDDDDFRYIKGCEGGNPHV